MEHQHLLSLACVAVASCANAVIAGGPVPANDNCANATVIPGSVTTYNPALYNTTGATNDACSTNESCEAGGAGTSNSVWYSYTPAASGTIDVNTFGSSYNTVLSIWNSCAGSAPPFCFGVMQLACNDNTVGNLSQIVLDVTAGVSYAIKVADYDSADGGGSLDFNLRWIPPNDVCSNATQVNSTNFNPPTYSTANADLDACEALESCEVNNVGVSNSVWYRLCSLENGTITIDTNGSTYDTVVSIFNACSSGFPSCSSPAQLACDDDSGIGTQSQIADFPVQAGVDYYIKISDYNTAIGGGLLDFNLVFEAACPGDTNDDGQITVLDLLDVINGWGACP